MSDAAGTPIVVEAIRRAIDASGPITFAEYMDLALYGPGGFYETPPVGVGGDFVTSPHVHPMFGTLLAGAVRELGDRLGRPGPLRIAELGAGDGTLARSVVSSLSGEPIEYTAIERSLGARASLASIEGVRVAEELTAPVDVVLANELLDNLPFRVLRGHQEVRIARDGERLVERLVPAEDTLARATPSNEERIVPVGAFDVIDRIADSLQRGFALLIDYGGIGEAGGPLHGYRGQAIVHDVLAMPGATDITAGVDFGSIGSRAEADGLVAFPPVTQHEALLALGLHDWLRGQLEAQGRALDEGSGLDAVRTWSGRSRASLLVDPGGLGRLRWLLLATPGLEPPGWLTRASRGSSGA